MTDRITLNRLSELYTAHAFTHNYIFGFAYNKHIYAVEIREPHLADFVILDSASSKNGSGFSIRFKPSNLQKEMLLSEGAEMICTEAYLEGQVKELHYNRGEIFEKIITELSGQEWKKDNVPFFKGADLTVNGIDYQIKFNKATFATEKLLLSL